MKLRLENGNFSIKATWDEESEKEVYNSLPTGLKPIDFLGAVVDDGEIFCIVANATDEEGNVISLRFLNYTNLYYNAISGKIYTNIDEARANASK